MNPLGPAYLASQGYCMEKTWKWRHQILSYHRFKKKFSLGHAMWHVGSYFPDQGSNPLPMLWKHRILTTGPPGKFLFPHRLSGLVFLN